MAPTSGKKPVSAKKVVKKADGGKKKVKKGSERCDLGQQRRSCCRLLLPVLCHPLRLCTATAHSHPSPPPAPAATSSTCSRC